LRCDALIRRGGVEARAKAVVICFFVICDLLACVALSPVEARAKAVGFCDLIFDFCNLFFLFIRKLMRAKAVFVICFLFTQKTPIFSLLTHPNP
jgi:hypothetical protein